MSLILVVDDDAIIREPIQAVLQSAGYETATACSGLEALTCIAQRIPDLVMLDVTMPQMDGLATLHLLREQSATRNLPVVMLTHAADRGVVAASVRLGVQGYLLKGSCSVSHLLAEVARVLGMRHAPHEHPGALPLASKSQSASPSTPHVPATGPTVMQTVATSCRANTAESVSDDQLMKPIMPKSAVTRALDKCGELKGFSPVVAEVLKLTNSNSFSIDQLAKAISRDHAVALKVLRIANSAVYTRGEPVDSVQRAVSRIGVQQIRQVVLNLAVMERFKSDCIDLNQFWEHAIATGIISAEIAHCRDPQEADAAFTIGLLHDVGRLALAEQLGDAYRQVIDAGHQTGIPLEHVESRMLGVTHADIMGRLLRQWKFSGEFINPIAFHHLSANNIRGAAPRETMQIATLALADRLAHGFMLGTSGNDCIYATEDLCDLLRLDASNLEHIIQVARSETDKVKLALLSVSRDQGGWLPMRDVHCNTLATPVRPLFVSSRPMFDALRIFCIELANASEGQMPNIAVMHIRNAKEREPLAERLGQMELDNGCSRLPLIVLSPAGKLTADVSLCASRAVETVSVPFAVPRFISAVNKLIRGSSVELPAHAMPRGASVSS